MTSRICLAVVCWIFGGCTSAFAQNAPATEPLSAHFTVTIDGQPVPTYLARICNLTADQRKPLGLPQRAQTSEASFASFDEVPTTQRIPPLLHVTVTCHDPVQSVKILPVWPVIVPAVADQTITFTVDRPGALTVEVNGNWIESLHLFVNPPELNVPKATDPNVIFFGPGVHQVEHLEVRSGQTLYLAPGAVLYGKPTGERPGGVIIGLAGDNITLCGRGIIDGSLCPRGTRSILYTSGKNITIDGVTLRDSSGWTLQARRCENLRIHNVKIFGWQGNSDGMDICNSRHVDVSDCFLRTFDDLVVLKTDQGQGPESDINVHQCVLWNEFAHALSLGAELREPLSDIHFSDCDVIHDKGREWLLRVYNCDAAPVSDVTWDNIRIEECRRLMSLWIGQAIWSKQPERGHIQDIIFRNITSVAPEVPNSTAVLTGFDAAHTIDHVQFQTITVAGQPLTSAQITQNAFVHDVTVTP